MTQDEIQAIRAIFDARRIGSAVDDADIDSLEAEVIAALDAARGDPVAQVVEWLRAMKRDDTNWPQHIAFLIERGEPFNG